MADRVVNENHKMLNDQKLSRPKKMDKASVTKKIKICNTTAKSESGAGCVVHLVSKLFKMQNIDRKSNPNGEK